MSSKTLSRNIMKSLPLPGKDLGKKADLIDESAFLPFGDL